MKPTISKPFKSNDRTFDKVYNAFDKRDYFNSQGLAKTQIGNFERALQKNDKGAQQVLDLFKGDEKKAKDYITQVISDRNKERAFNNYKALKSAVDSIQKGKPNVGAVDYVKRIIHNSSQKYSIALYSTLRNKKFTKWKDVHNDIDSLVSESVNEILVIVDKFDKRKQDYDKVYYQDGGKRPGDGDINKAKKEFAKLSKKHKGLTLISVDRNSKMYDVMDESVNEGKKRYYQQDRVGSAKYTISYHDGKKKHKDGSDFFDIQTFKNKKDLAKFVNTLHKGGYVYGFNESVNEGISVFDERHFGKKGIIIMIDDNGKKVSAIFKDKKNADKFNRNKPSDIKKLLQLAKKTKFPKAIDESVNEGKVHFKKKLKSGNIFQVIDRDTKGMRGTQDKFSMQIVDKKGKVIKNIGSHPSLDGAKKYSNTIKEDKNQIIQIKKKVGKSETKFYDTLSTIEKKLGKRKYRIWLEKSLKDFGENPKHYDYRTNAAAEEKLFQLGK